MGGVINLALMKNPYNWINITLLALMGALALDLLTRSAMQDPE